MEVPMVVLIVASWPPIVKDLNAPESLLLFPLYHVSTLLRGLLDIRASVILTVGLVRKVV